MKSSTRDKFQRHLISKMLLGEFSDAEMAEIADAFVTSSKTLNEVGASLVSILQILSPSSRKKQDPAHLMPPPPPPIPSILTIIKNYSVPHDIVLHMIARVSHREMRFPKRLSSDEMTDYIAHLLYSLSESEQEDFVRLFNKEVMGGYQEDLYLNLITKKSSSNAGK